VTHNRKRFQEFVNGARLAFCVNQSSRDNPQRNSLHNHKEGVMSAKSVFKMGFLSMIAATGLFVASNGFATEAHTTSQSEGVKATAGWVDLKIPETPAPPLQVADSKGNVYLLTPLKTSDGKVSVEYVTPYTNPTSH
jgi:hypothetical protein